MRDAALTIVLVDGLVIVVSASCDAAGEDLHDAPYPFADPAVYRNRAERASLAYRPIGRAHEAYPEWVRALRDQSGVYVIRDRGTREVLYVGESHSGNLYETMTRHFQRWTRWKRWWDGQYADTSGHDPGITYARDAVEVATRVTTQNDAIDEERRLIERLRPRDNLRGQPVDDEPDDDEPIPF
jgi:hypothetical protein